jgi:Domain of unknown function (DUF4965)/Domain of unknown function (DUF1793)/Domain of unknown function (DUF5127)/Domain of unknown function (DUF4964)
MRIKLGFWVFVLFGTPSFFYYSLAQSVRVPAVPLVTHDPYFSVWSMNDRLTDGQTRHWTGTVQALIGLVRVDGKVFRWMGTWPQSAPSIGQTALEVTATRTTYRFEEASVRLEVAFLSPLLPFDLDVMARPISYVTATITATDPGSHQVQLLLGVSPVLATDTSTQEVVWSRSRLRGMTVLRASNFQQPVLEKTGDNLRIDWGSVLLAVPDQSGATAATEAKETVQSIFAAGNPFASDDLDMPRRASEGALLAVSLDFGRVGSESVSRHILVGYDDLYSIEYLKRWMRPYWRRNGMTTGELLDAAEREYSAIDQRSRELDKRLASDLRQVGGEAYADLATLAFRQTIAAHKLVVDVDGQPMLFPKENFSNGCISTVDVIYPSSPFFLFFNAELLKAELRPLMEYTRTGHWRFPFAPHDLGTYPKANGQVYGGGERTEENQMPVEESGNMLLMFAALAQVEGNADFANRYWPELQRWAEYLRHEGMDPANQLSTDDFSGHLAHNSNLSIKAILALAGFATLADQTSHKAEALEYRNLSRNMAERWVELAGDGDHFRLSFDKPGTWSQKYNLVWDRILDLKVFPPSVARTESQFYRAHLKEFGLPLDSRSDYTKLDWEVWTATLAENRQEFDRMILPLQRFIRETPSRVPLTDWYWTTDGRQQGFQARSVVGGVFLPMIADHKMWRKWNITKLVVPSSRHRLR